MPVFAASGGSYAADFGCASPRGALILTVVRFWTAASVPRGRDVSSADRKPNLSFRDDQADALRRRRLSDPVAALGDPLQHARLPERARRGRAAPRGAGHRRRHPPPYL